MLERPDFGTGLQGAVQMVSEKSLLLVFFKCLPVSDTVPDTEGTAGVRQILLVLLTFIPLPTPARQGKWKYAHQHTVSDGAVGEN